MRAQANSLQEITPHPALRATFPPRGEGFSGGGKRPRPLRHGLRRATLPLLSLRDIFPRSGGSLSSKGEALAVHANFISLPSHLPFGAGGFTV